MSYLLTLSGSLRAASFNTTLLRTAGAAYGGDVVMGSLRMPLYDGDLEDAEGVPVEAQTLADQIKGAEAVVISTPEYNKALSGVLKNALDWVSRTKGGPWVGKPVAIVSATAGRAGGERAQSSLRLCLQPFRPHLLQGPEVLVGQAFDAFDESGALKDERYQKALDELMGALKTAAAAAK